MEQETIYKQTSLFIFSTASDLTKHSHKISFGFNNFNYVTYIHLVLTNNFSRIQTLRSDFRDFFF